jgi:hypothetical protein
MIGKRHPRLAKILKMPTRCICYDNNIEEANLAERPPIPNENEFQLIDEVELQ